MELGLDKKYLHIYSLVTIDVGDVVVGILVIVAVLVVLLALCIHCRIWFTFKV